MHADTVDLRVAGDWEGSERVRLADGRVRIERAALTFSDPRHGFATLPDDAWLDVEAAGATLQDLRLEPGTELTLERADGEALAVYATDGGAAGSLLVNGSVTLTWGEADGAAPQTRTFRVDVPERITFSAGDRGACPRAWCSSQGDVDAARPCGFRPAVRARGRSDAGRAHVRLHGSGRDSYGSRM